MTRERWLVGVLALMAVVQVLFGLILLRAYDRVNTQSHRLVYLEHKELCSSTADCDALLSKVIRRISARERRAIAAAIVTARAAIVASARKGVRPQPPGHGGQHPGPAQGPTTQ
jgi:hypothetical protein